MGNARGSKNGNAVLTEAEVREIKSLLKQGTTVSELCRHFCVSGETISRIRTGRTWAWVGLTDSVSVLDAKLAAVESRPPTEAERMAGAIAELRFRKKYEDEGLTHLIKDYVPLTEEEKGKLVQPSRLDALAEELKKQEAPDAGY